MSRPWYCIGVFAWLLAGSIAHASTITSFNGNFIFDDDVQFFTYSTPSAGLVTVNTTSFAQGGFAPILGLYDSTGNLIFTVDGQAQNDCGVAGPDPATGFCYDAQMSW